MSVTGPDQGEPPPATVSIPSHFTPAPTPRPDLLAQAFEFLNHSVTLLEKESCLQQIKIQQLEGENWPRVEVRLEAGPVKVSQVRPGWEKLDEFGFQARVW